MTPCRTRGDKRKNYGMRTNIQLDSSISKKQYFIANYKSDWYCFCREEDHLEPHFENLTYGCCKWNMRPLINEGDEIYFISAIKGQKENWITAKYHIKRKFERWSDAKRYFPRAENGGDNFLVADKAWLAPEIIDEYLGNKRLLYNRIGFKQKVYDLEPLLVDEEIAVEVLNWNIRPNVETYKAIQGKIREKKGNTILVSVAKELDIKLGIR